MKTLMKFTVWLLMSGLALAAAPQKQGEFLESFSFQGRSYSLFAEFSPPKAGLRLAGPRNRDLTTGLAGENILLGTRTGAEHFYVFWIHYRNKTSQLAYYDHRFDRCRVLPLAGFRFFALPDIIEENGVLRGLVFLGNRDGNDDIFHYSLETRELTALTRTPFSEKGFTMKAAGAAFEIETRSLWKTFRYRFDPQQNHCELLEERALPRPRQRATIDIDPSRYYNTYIGFGDSITRSQWEGQEWPELGYLAKMGAMLAKTYGPNWSINLGIGGTQTYEGAARVESDLENNPAFYFILFYGVNDLIHNDFSLESSLESLEFMIDAAQTRGMRVITTTLTPRKDKLATTYYWDRLYALSAGIIALAGRKGAACIDPLTVFMNTNPPDGWMELLESVNPPISKGNHPNEEGHRIIASLFAPVLEALPPHAPQNISLLATSNSLQKTANWDMNLESDFSHYQIEFGFLPEALDYSLTTAASHHTFVLFPFLPQLYFSLRAVDRGNHASEQNSLDAAHTASAPAGKRSGTSGTPRSRQE
jgi:lysophospholipase L1-like esterase